MAYGFRTAIGAASWQGCQGWASHLGVPQAPHTAQWTVYQALCIRCLCVRVSCCWCCLCCLQSLDGVFAHSLTNLLTGAQIAAACVASYPYLPRWHAMMSTLKMQEQQQQLRQQQQGSGPVGARAASQRRSSRVRAATHHE